MILFMIIMYNNNQAYSQSIHNHTFSQRSTSS